MYLPPDVTDEFEEKDLVDVDLAPLVDDLLHNLLAFKFVHKL